MASRRIRARPRPSLKRASITDRLIDLALEEDLGEKGDLTSQALIPPGAVGRAELWAKERMVLSGLQTFARVFRRVDPKVRVKVLFRDGQEVRPMTLVAVVHGRLVSLLVAERTALNLLQKTCGIATLSRRAVHRVRGSTLEVLDTRKTPPGMRALAKAAVRDGGARNHRFGLYDAVLIKDNHIAACNGSIALALERARRHVRSGTDVEIEVRSLQQLKEAFRCGARHALLDNMSNAQIRRAVTWAKGRVRLEASGGVTIDRLATLKRLGVDSASVGQLTHSAPAMDLALKIVNG